MPHWVFACHVDELPPGTARELIVEDQVVALFHVAGEFHALDGICPHQGGPLGRGSLQGHLVTCPWHGWRFDVRSGQHEANRSLCHRRLAVEVRDGSVYVDVT